MLYLGSNKIKGSINKQSQNDMRQKITCTSMPVDKIFRANIHT